MEAYKEFTAFGFTFKGKKGIKISPEEIEEAKKILRDVGKGINQTADFIKKNDLAEPIFRGTKNTYKTLIIFFSIVIIVSILSLIFAGDLMTSILALLVLRLLCRALILISIIVIGIMLLIGYAINK
jgi:hypothetical protein